MWAQNTATLWDITSKIRLQYSECCHASLVPPQPSHSFCDSTCHVTSCQWKGATMALWSQQARKGNSCFYWELCFVSWITDSCHQTTGWAWQQTHFWGNLKMTSVPVSTLCCDRLSWAVPRLLTHRTYETIMMVEVTRMRDNLLL